MVIEVELFTISDMVVQTSGDPKNEPILFIHGAASSSWSWEQVVQKLPEFYCVIPDLPEHGKSKKTGKFSIEESTERMIELISVQFPGQQINLFGHSVGGQIALNLLAKRPDLFKSAILSGAQVVKSPGYRLGIYSEAVMTLIYWLGIAPWKKNDGWIHMNMTGSVGIKSGLFAEFKGNFQGLSRNAWAHSMSENYSFRMPESLEKVDLPVLMLAGTKELTDVRPSMDLLQKKLRNSQAFLFGTGRNLSAAQEHNWLVNDPELCVRLVREWVAHRKVPAGFVPYVGAVNQKK